MNVKLDTYNMRELGRPYKKKAPMTKKNHVRNLGLQRQRTSKLDSPKGDFNWAAIILSRPNRQYSLPKGRERLLTGYKITLSPTIA